MEYKNIKNSFINILLTYLHGRPHPNLRIKFPNSAVLQVISYNDIDFIVKEKHKSRVKAEGNIINYILSFFLTFFS